jgi:hypothetical protein
MRARIFRHREDGQSLVEVAFMLPVLLLLAVGIVELGNALNAYNQTINAAREGVRFGSMGGSDSGVMTIVQGAASQLTTYDDSNSDLYVVRADLTGTAPNCAVDPDTFSCMQVLGRDDDNLDTNSLDTTCIAEDELVQRFDSGEIFTCDLEVIAVDLYYQSPSLLRLPLVKQLSESVPMRSLAVMRLENPRPLAGVCNAYPIAVHRSMLEGKKKGDIIGDSLTGVGEGDFGWLRWPNDPSGGSSETLADSLERPTTSEFENADPAYPNDTHLSVGDWIWANTGVGNDIKVRDALDGLVNKGWIRVVVFDDFASGGSNGMFHAENFAIVKLLDFNLPNENRLKMEFVAMDSTGCVE